MTGQQERGLILLMIAGLLVGGLVLLWPKSEQSPTHLARPIVFRDVAVVAPRFMTPQKVDVNTADADELAKLPGVGPALAARVVEYRSAHGPFRTLDDLVAVKGIGPAIVDRLREASTVVQSP